MKNLYWILSLFLAVMLVSTGFASEMSPEKAKYYQAVENAKAAFESGQVINDSQRQLLKAEGLIRDPSQGTYGELDRTGGPDDYGYYFIDSEEDGGPIYEWVDISETGTEILGLSDDIVVGPYNVGFTFPYYDNEYTQFRFDSNGHISFNDQRYDYSNETIPSAGTPNNCIFYFWDDMNPDSGTNGEAFYQTIGDNTLIVQLVDYRELGNGSLNCEIILYENGFITMQYQSFDNNIDMTSCTIGIENSNGTDGLEYAFNNTNEMPDAESAILYYTGGMERDASVSGTVTDSETGDGVAEATVAILLSAPVTTDDDGNYLVEEAMSGDNMVIGVRKEHYYPYSAVVEIETGENDIDIEITPLATMSGIIYDSETEEPVAGAVISWSVQIDTSDEDGLYEFIDMRAGTNELLIEAEGYFEYLDTLEVEDGDTELDFAIDILSGDLTGNVIDEITEEVLVGVDIVVIDELGDTVREVQTDDLGSYIALALHSGETFGVVASLAGYAPSDTENVTISHTRENVRDFELTPIFERTVEQLQTTQDPETWVLTTGIVTQGTNLTDTSHTNIYIQDDSDWGIQVWADAPWDAETEIMRGDAVEVVGYLLDVDDITRITNFEITVTSNDNALPEPLVEPTGDMSTNGQREGTWAQINGQINRDPGDGTYSLVVNDGSGQCEVQITGTANLDLSAFSADDWGTFTGVISLSRQGLRLIPNDQADIERINIDAPSDLTSAQEVVPGDPLQLEVTLSWTHEHLDDFVRFKIYRDDEHIGNTQQNSWNEKIEDPNPGEYESYTYVYAVTAIYDEGETPESNEVEVIWDITLVGDREFSGIPTEWAVAATYPNPFNPTVSVVLAVPQIAEVHTEIINVLGQSVATLHNGSLNAGYHRLNWNATNHPAGLYLLNVTSNTGFREIRKLMYVK